MVSSTQIDTRNHVENQAHEQRAQRLKQRQVELRDAIAELEIRRAEVAAIKAQKPTDPGDAGYIGCYSWAWRYQQAVWACNRALYRKWTVGVLTEDEYATFAIAFPFAADHGPFRVRSLPRPSSPPRPVIAKAFPKIADQVASGKLNRERARQIVLSSSPNNKVEIECMFNWALRVAYGEARA
jgi:hypothetical protein